MTAEQYLNAVRAVSTQIAELAAECKQERMWLYNITGVDPGKEKVTGNRAKDLSDKILVAEQSYNRLQKKLARLYEIRENCRLMIEGMECDDEILLKNAQGILRAWYLLDMPRKNIAQLLHISHTQNAYRALKPALMLFEQNYNKWLQSMKEVL